jgi:serine/threonine-protein kinase RsbW
MAHAPSLHAHLVLGSRFEHIEIAERTLLDLVAQADCNHDEQYWIVTALREAIANAVRHGNREQPERKVRVDYRIEGRTVTIRVEDEGDGFDPGQIPDPTREENLLRPSGRGIFYMQQFMNRVEFSCAPEGGTTVVMVKELLPNSRSDGNEE